MLSVAEITFEIRRKSSGEAAAQAAE